MHELHPPALASVLIRVRVALLAHADPRRSTAPSALAHGHRTLSSAYACSMLDALSLIRCSREEIPLHTSSWQKTCSPEGRSKLAPGGRASTRTPHLVLGALAPSHPRACWDKELNLAIGQPTPANPHNQSGCSQPPCGTGLHSCRNYACRPLPMPRCARSVMQPLYCTIIAAGKSPMGSGMVSAG